MRTMLKKITVLSFYFFVAIATAQFVDSSNENEMVSKSIYTIPMFSMDNFSTFSINNKLKLNSFSFVILDEESIKDGYFVVPFHNTFKKPSHFIFDSYEKMKNTLILESAFYKVSDLYRPRRLN